MNETDRQMAQYAPWPTALEDAVREFRYMEGWTFHLLDIPRDFDDVDREKPIAGGLTFVIHVPCNDSYHPEKYRPDPPRGSGVDPLCRAAPERRRRRTRRSRSRHAPSVRADAWSRR
jgi:hypothetical protein